MQLGLRTKLTLIMTGLVLLSVTVLSSVFFEQLLQQVMHDTDKRAKELAHEVFDSAQQRWSMQKRRDCAQHPMIPKTTREYVKRAFEMSEGLSFTVASRDGDSRLGLEVIHCRSRWSRAGIQRPIPAGKVEPRRTPFDQLVQSPFVRQVRMLTGRSRTSMRSIYPSIVRGASFGEVRVAVSTALAAERHHSQRLKRWGTLVALALGLSTVLAAVVSGAALAPIRDILAQLERISRGEYDHAVPSRKNRRQHRRTRTSTEKRSTQVGQQLRGVHEIFSSLRENMNSVMAGLEDGLLLFTRDARAVMVSPAAEKFLGAPASNFLGRRVTDIFPPGHPLYEALHLEGDEFHEVASETELVTQEGRKRISVSVQEIQEAGEHMGALVTLRDLDSIESINTQLQVSERLAAVGRITAGVAHEVKNPLNSMRLWLENLKEALPPETDGWRSKRCTSSTWKSTGSTRS